MKISLALAFGVIIAGLFLCATGAQADVIGGNGAATRPNVDGGDGMLFFDLNNSVQLPGLLTEWSVFATPAHSGTGQLKLKIFRSTGSVWQFVGDTPLATIYQWGGMNTFTLPQPISVHVGDIIAFWYPDNTVASIVYSSEGQTMNNHDWSAEPMPDIQADIPDLLHNRNWHDTYWDISTRTYSVELRGIPDQAALGGNGTQNRSIVDSGEGILFFDLNHPLQIGGTLTDWAIFASSGHSGTGQLKLKIFRDIGDTWQFVGDSPLETVYQWGFVNTFSLPQPISVNPGDIIAFWYPDATVPSIAFGNAGQTMNNHDWPSEPMPDIQTDIPDLVNNPYWHDTPWDINTRTYSIELYGLADAMGVPPSAAGPQVLHLQGPFPNPAPGAFRVRLDARPVEPATAGLFTSDGRLVWSSRDSKAWMGLGGKELLVDPSRGRAPAGTYFLRVATPTSSAVSKVTLIR